MANDSNRTSDMQLTEELIAALRAQLLAADSAPGANKTQISAVIAKFAAHKQARVRPGSWRSMSSRLRTIAAQLGSREWSELTHEVADEYIDTREEQGVSRSTAAQEVGLLASVLGWAVKRRLIPYSPLQGYESGAKPKRRDRVYTDAEIDELVRVAGVMGEVRLRAVVVVMRWTGIRPVELLRSKQADLDWDTGLLRIPEDNAKTGTERYCVIQPDGLEALRAVPRKGQTYLLESPRWLEEHASMAALNQQWRRVAEAARVEPNEDGSPPILYSLRHTLATRLALREGYNEFQLCQALGWADVAMARKYVRTTRAQLLEQARRLGR